MAQTTHRASAPRPDMVAVKSVGNGDITYADITLKQDAEIYESGQLLVLEHTESEPGSGEFDVAGAKYIKLVGSDWKAFAVKKLAVNLYRTNASEGDVDVTAAVRLAEIKPKETDLGALSSGDQAIFVAAAEAQFLIVG